MSQQREIYFISVSMISLMINLDLRGILNANFIRRLSRYSSVNFIAVFKHFPRLPPTGLQLKCFAEKWVNLR